MSSVGNSEWEQTGEALRTLYEESSDGVVVADLQGAEFISANRAMCRMLGYARDELLSLSVDKIHPAESLPRVQAMFRAMAERRLKCARGIPCLRKEGSVVYADISATHITYQGRPCLLGLFHDITEQKRTMELLRDGENRYRAIANNVADVIWTVEFPKEYIRERGRSALPEEMAEALLEHWRFSYVSPAAESIFGYTSEESTRLCLRDLIAPDELGPVKEAIVAEISSFDDSPPSEALHKRFLEVDCLAKDGSRLRCEIVSSYMRDDTGEPTGLLGIARDVTERCHAEKALRDSEAMLRVLFENLPDMVVMLDRDANIQFVNRSSLSASDSQHVGSSVFAFALPEHLDACQSAFNRALNEGKPQTIEAQDVYDRWWSCRIVPVAGESGGVDNIIAIATDVTQTRLAAGAVKKEQQLMRRLLELHERERRLISYEIHDGFAQQLAGALFRLQGFRGALDRNPTEAWEGFDSAVNLLGRAIDETRRLISGLRPPVLDELGIVDAVQYLVYEHSKNAGPAIEFLHDLPQPRLPADLENAVFRIIQESLQNACRHSLSQKVRVSLKQSDDHVHIEVRDWGIGFDSATIEEERFGLQGIRERARLLNGRVTIDSAPAQGTRLSVSLPVASE